jgi:flagellar biosynthetic protein FliO
MGEFFLVLFSLLGVIGLIFLTYYGARWMNRKFNNGQGFNSSKGIKIVECTGISPDKQLVIVTVGKKSMMLGVTPSSISKICELDDEDMNVIRDNAAASVESNFLASLKKAVADRQQLHRKEESVNRKIVREDKVEPNDKDDF